MPGILREDKEELVEGANRKIGLCEVLKEGGVVMDDTTDNCKGHDGDAGESFPNGRNIRDCSTSDSELQGSSASETEADRSTASETLGEVRSASDPREGGDDADVGGDDADVGGDDADVGGGDDAEVGGDDADVGGASDEKGEGGKSKEKSGKMRGEGDGKVYNIHLSLPGVQQPVTVMLMSRDTVHDLLQFALERPECCYRTALSARHKGKRLDDFVEIGSIDGLAEEDTVQIVEEPYTQRDARLHVQRLKDLLSTDPFKQSLVGADGFSLSFLSAVAAIDDGFSKPVLAGLDVPDHIIPRESAETGGVPLGSFYPPNIGKHFKFPECLKSLSYSSWNPPPSHRKMKGDLLYLEIVTLEGQECFITATPVGFFLNKTTSRENFDPTPRKTSHYHKHLVALLCQVSPLFKKNFTQLQKFGESLHAFEIQPVPYPVVPWVAPPPQHKASNFRIDDTMSLRVVPDEFVLGQTRDCNEEIQAIREFPVDTSAARIFRDRALFKTHSEFTQACMRGAVAIVDGYLPSLNPGDDLKFRMFIWNSIFFSFAFDGTDQFKELGGDSAAHAAAAANLHGVASFERMETKGLYTSGTVLVDYRGYRVVCQTIVPGLLQREHDSSVVYGSLDGGKNITADSRFCELLARPAEELHIRHHSVRTEKGEVMKLPSSIEVKGIVGTDNRHYALDLCRIFPPDANFTDLPKEAKCRHKMAVLRPECLDTFLSYKFMTFLRLVREKAELMKTTGEEESRPSSSDSAESASKEPSSTGCPAAQHSEETLGTSDPEASTANTSQNPADTIQSPPDKSDVTVSGSDTAASSCLGDTNTEAQTTQNPAASNCLGDTNAEAETTQKPAATAPDSPLNTDEVVTGSSVNTSIKEDSTSEPESSNAISTCPHRSEDASSSNPADETKSSPVQAAPESKHSLPKSHPVAMPMASSRIALSALASASKPLLGNILEGGEKFASNELHLLDTLRLGEEKEVGPDVPRGIMDGDLLEAREQKLKGTEAAGQPQGTSAFRKALEEVGSLSQEEFLIQFNVDILTPQLQHADDEAVLAKDRELVKEASGFLVESVIFRFVHDCIQLLVTPMDGEGLAQAMHTRGINMRYLGRIAQLSALREDLHHIFRLCLSEMTMRLAKRKLRSLLQTCPMEATSECVSHFLNSLFSLVKGDVKEEANGQVRKKNKKKKSSRVQKPVHMRLCTQSLWAEIVDEMKWYYKCEVEYSSLNEMCSKNGINKTSLLRSICRKTGVQMLARNYNFSVHPVFSEDDIVAMYPLVTHTDIRPVEAAAVFDLALSKYGLGQLHVAHELFSNALHVFVQIYGSMHLDIANCYRHMARIEYALNNPVKALSSQHKATLVLERVLGVDHYETISAYINLALYCHTSNQSLPALRLLYRARYLIMLLFGEGHPELATCDTNIAIILHSFRNFHHSNIFLSSALSVQNRYNGSQSSEVALTHHLLARVQSYLGDFRAALGHEKITFTIYNKKYGSDHKKTKDSSQCLNDLTGKAVSMQKTINGVAGKASGSGKLWVELLSSGGDVDMVNGITDKSKVKPQWLMNQRVVRAQRNFDRLQASKKKSRKQKQQQQQQPEQEQQPGSPGSTITSEKN